MIKFFFFLAKNQNNKFLIYVLQGGGFILKPDQMQVRQTDRKVIIYTHTHTKANASSLDF